MNVSGAQRRAAHRRTVGSLGFKLLSRGMRCDGKFQRDLVFARDILGFNDVTAPAPGATNQVGLRRGVAEPSR
jgi:hypothetical protein